MNNPFASYNTESEIKKLYRRLAFEFHPDHGGTTADMQALNAFYHAALARISGSTSEHNGKEFTYRYDQEKEEAVIQMIDKLQSLKMQNVAIDLIGTWLWVHGETKQHKDSIKCLGLRWHAERGCWFFHTGVWSGRRSRGGLDSLAAKYGVQRFSSKRDQELN